MIATTAIACLHGETFGRVLAGSLASVEPTLLFRASSNFWSSSETVGFRTGPVACEGWRDRMFSCEPSLCLFDAPAIPLFLMPRGIEHNNFADNSRILLAQRRPYQSSSGACYRCQTRHPSLPSSVTRRRLRTMDGPTLIME